MNRQILKWQIPSSVAPSPLFNSVAASRKVNKHENNLIEFITRITSSTLVQIKTQLSLSLLSFTQIQIFGYNSQLYTNFSDAMHRAQGIVAVSILLQVSLSWNFVQTNLIYSRFMHFSLGSLEISQIQSFAYSQIS